MTLHLRPVPLAADTLRDEAHVSEAARHELLNAYGRYMRAKMAVAQARTDAGHDRYKNAFREQMKAREFFTEHALEFTRLLIADDHLE